MKKTDEALELLDRGWSIIPIRPDTKRPRIRWREFQDRLPTEEEVSSWWDTFPDDEIALLTGHLSGLVVVDCDNEEALHAAFDANMRSPVRVKTRRGWHLYFKHPRDGIRRGPKAGINSRGDNWPRINGLDFRGDGSYALVPPSTNYTWEIVPAHYLEDAPLWKDWTPELQPVSSGEFEFGNLDLSDVRPLSEFISEWDRTSKFASEHFKDGKIPTGEGNGRNERVMKYASECLLDGYFGAELRVKCNAFMDEFFVDPLQESEFNSTVASMEQSERRNHPERFDERGEYIFRHPDRTDIKSSARTRRLITMNDIKELEAAASSTHYLIEPWLQTGSITQIHGYSGHGKTMFIQHSMAALASGRRYMGPFECNGPAKILYLDFEMGRSTIARRLAEMRQVHGDTMDRLMVWTPFIDEVEMNFHTKEGVAELQLWIEFSSPDVVVIDTIRTAWPGLQENSAEQWSLVNSLAVRLRNAGIAVILIHHSNKPSGENGLGREAGSTNQLTVVETQIRITQVYEDKDTAKSNAALWDGDYPSPVWPKLSSRIPPDWRLYMVLEVRYGKVREWTDLHDRIQWIGFAENNIEDERVIVASRSTKQKAKDMALESTGEEDIAKVLGRPVRVIKDWLS